MCENRETLGQRTEAKAAWPLLKGEHRGLVESST